jgi:hypothetical protein
MTPIKGSTVKQILSRGPQSRDSLIDLVLRESGGDERNPGQREACRRDLREVLRDLSRVGGVKFSPSHGGQYSIAAQGGSK